MANFVTPQRKDEKSFGEMLRESAARALGGLVADVPNALISQVGSGLRDKWSDERGIQANKDTVTAANTVLQDQASAQTAIEDAARAEKEAMAAQEAKALEAKNQPSLLSRATTALKSAFTKEEPAVPSADMTPRPPVPTFAAANAMTQSNVPAQSSVVPSSLDETQKKSSGSLIPTSSTSTVKSRYGGVPLTDAQGELVKSEVDTEKRANAGASDLVPHVLGLANRNKESLIDSDYIRRQKTRPGTWDAFARIKADKSSDERSTGLASMTNAMAGAHSSLSQYSGAANQEAAGYANLDAAAARITAAARKHGTGRPKSIWKPEASGILAAARLAFDEVPGELDENGQWNTPAKRAAQNEYNKTLMTLARENGKTPEEVASYGLAASRRMSFGNENITADNSRGDKALQARIDSDLAKALATVSEKNRGRVHGAYLRLMSIKEDTITGKPKYTPQQAWDEANRIEGD